MNARPLQTGFRADSRAIGTVADEVVRRRPGLKVLFTTGYTRNAIVHLGRRDADVQMSLGTLLRLFYNATSEQR